MIEVDNHVAGYRIYKTVWEPSLGESLVGEMEPTNEQDCHTVCVKKEGCVVDHLEKGTSGKFAQIIFFFLRANKTASCDIIVTGRPVNLGDKKGQKVPCKQRLAG